MSAQTPPEGLPPRPTSLINRIVAFALQQRMLMVLLALGLAAAGVWSCNILPMDAYPNLSPPMVERGEREVAYRIANMKDSMRATLEGMKACAESAAA